MISDVIIEGLLLFARFGNIQGIDVNIIFLQKKMFYFSQFTAVGYSDGNLLNPSLNPKVSNFDPNV